MRLRFGVQRALALAVLVALIAGPTGIAGVLHPFDDVEYRQATQTDQHSGCQHIGAPEEPEAHCPTCHLLRGVRWGLSTTPLHGLVPEAVAPLASTIDTAAPRGHLYTTPGRSPPASDPVQAA